MAATTGITARAGRVTTGRDPDRLASAAMAVAMAIAFVLILVLSRGTSLSPDELAFFLGSHDLGVNHALEPYGGHLILTSKVLYKVLFEAFGTGYVPFRLLAAGTVLTTAGLLFVYGRRRIGAVAALPPAVLMLFFGSDALHVLAGNSFTVVAPMALGIGALLALDRGDRRGDVLACVLLCVAVVTYSTALAVVAGVIVLLLLAPDGRRRLWVPAVPVALYGVWFVWAHVSATAKGSSLVLANVLLIPTWCFQSLEAVMAALTGMDYHFASAPAVAPVGPVLALIAIVALVWSIRRFGAPAALWAVLTIPLVLWSLQAVAADKPGNFPGSPHYLYPGAVIVLLVAIEASRSLRWTRGMWIGLYAVGAVALATNLALLNDASKEARTNSHAAAAGRPGRGGDRRRGRVARLRLRRAGQGRSQPAGRLPRREGGARRPAHRGLPGLGPRLRPPRLPPGRADRAGQRRAPAGPGGDRHRARLGPGPAAAARAGRRRRPRHELRPGRHAVHRAGGQRRGHPPRRRPRARAPLRLGGDGPGRRRAARARRPALPPRRRPGDPLARHRRRRGGPDLRAALAAGP